MQATTRSTIAGNGIDIAITARGSGIFTPMPHGLDEAGRRLTRNTLPGETAFAVLRSSCANSGLADAAMASYQNCQNKPFGFVSFPAQGVYPDEAFIDVLLQHVEDAHRHEGTKLGLSVPAGCHAEPDGTACLRYYNPADPPLSFDRRKENKCIDRPRGDTRRATRHAASTAHTDGAQAYPDLYRQGGALFNVLGDGDDDDDSDDDSDDGEEHDEDLDDGDGASARWRAVINSGKASVSMYLSVPEYVDGKHVASRRTEGRNEQFQSLEIELQPGDMLLFTSVAGILLTHQAVLTAEGLTSIMVMDYRFVLGAPRSPPAAPTEAPPSWDGWRAAPRKARQAKSDRACEERVLNPVLSLNAPPHLDLCLRPRTDQRLALNSGHRGREQLRRQDAQGSRLHQGHAALGGAEAQRDPWSQRVRERWLASQWCAATGASNLNLTLTLTLTL